MRQRQRQRQRLRAAGAGWRTRRTGNTASATAHAAAACANGRGRNGERETRHARAHAGATGDRMIIRTGDGRAIQDYEPAHVPGHVIHVRGDTAMFRRRAVQPTRRALLHVQAPGDPAVPPDLVRWYTERSFHFYLAGLRLPGPASLPLLAGKPARRLGPAFADLDAACAQLRAADGIDTGMVMAGARGAPPSAPWCAPPAQPSETLYPHPPGTG